MPPVDPSALPTPDGDGDGVAGDGVAALADVASTTSVAAARHASANRRMRRV